MERIKIVSIKEYHGSSYDGRAYTRLNIVDSTGRQLSAFKNQANYGWKAGDEIDVDVEQRGKYFNIKSPQSNRPNIPEKLAAIETKLDKILSILTSNKEAIPF